MKGVIPRCLAELVQDKYGMDRWKEILKSAGQDPNMPNFLVVSDIDDALVMKLVEITMQSLGMTPQELADAFGAYWMDSFAPKYYSAYLRNVKGAAEFLLKIDWIHTMTTKAIQGAKPPRFSYSWPNDRTLEIRYDSNRGLIDFAVGLAKGVGRHFGEDLHVSKVSANRFQIVFPRPQELAQVQK